MNDNALTTVANVQADYPALTDTNLLERKINLVSQQLENWMRYELGQSQRTIHVHGSGEDLLALPHRPIKTVSEIKLDGSVIDDYSIRDTGGVNRGKLYRYLGWPRPYLLAPLTCDPVYHGAKTNLEITYTAGWELPPSGGTECPLPPDIEQVVIEAVADLITNPPSSRYVAEERIPGGAAVKWETINSGSANELLLAHFGSIKRYRGSPFSK